MSYPRTTLLALVGLIWSAAPVIGQPLGAFRWQVLPHCNVLTLTVTQQNAIYTLDGTDDRCGDGQAASAVGVAFLNPNGTVGFGLTTVLPGGTPLHFEAAIGLSSLGGTWRDSSGNSGALVLIQGASFGGTPRPGPSGSVAAGSITAVQLASGAVGPSAIAAGAVVSSAIAAGAVGSPALATNAVTGGHVMDGTLTRADLADAPRASAAAENSDWFYLVEGPGLSVAETTLVAPAAGRVIVNAGGSFHFASIATVDAALCSLTTGTNTIEPYSAMAIERTASSYDYVPFGGTRAFTVAAGSSTTFRLVCRLIGSDVRVVSAALTALFVAGS
jgi:hypothetical protein